MSESLEVAGRYTLLNRLGVGGMGEVWRAHDQMTNQAVAVKVLKPSIAGAPAAELRFEREIQAMARLEHDGIVPVIDAGADPVVGLFFVMTLQHGRPLHEAASEWNSWRNLWPVVDQILETLSHAHAQGVIHRDIKPDNILVNSDGSAVLLDFGVARLKDQARSGTSAYDMLGTVDYAAPEQATGNRRRIGPWTDLYCFGVVLFEMICGRLPFWASSPVQSLMMRLDHPCPPLDPRPGFETPVGLDEVLRRLVRPNPFERIRHAHDARQAFSELLGAPYEIINPRRGNEPSHPIHPPARSAPTESLADEVLARRHARFAQGIDGSLVHRPLEAPLRLAPLLGRDELLLQLSRGLDRWRHEPKPGVLVLAGPEGVGKSRLAEALVTPFLAAGQIEGHRHHWRVGSSVREVALSVAGAVGLDGPTATEHLNWWLMGQGLKDATERRQLVDWAMGPARGARLDAEGQSVARFLEVTAQPSRPFVLTLDGLERLEPAALALVYGVRKLRLPVIVLVTTRTISTPPEIPEPKWLEPATRFLGPLSEKVLDSICQDLAELEPDDRAAIIRGASGNPKRALDGIVNLRREGRVIPAWPRWVMAPPGWYLPDDSLDPSESFDAE